jgi:phospholipid-binding lipoprotein MlaA
MVFQKKIFLLVKCVLLLVIGILLLLPGVVLAEQGEEFDLLNDDFFEEEVDAPLIYDPLEPMNRVFFSFNDQLYSYVLDPLATGYATVVPVDARGCIKNFFNNLREPVVFVNTLLQGRFVDSGKVIFRFLINSTLGAYGLADVATKEFDFPPVHATLGETMSIWGVGEGFYLVVPFFGPTTLRDGFGSLVENISLTPYYTWSDDQVVLGSLYFGKEINDFSFHLGEYDDLKALTLDPYSSIRNVYIQHRAHVRSRGNEEER